MSAPSSQPLQDPLPSAVADGAQAAPTHVAQSVVALTLSCERELASTIREVKTDSETPALLVRSNPTTPSAKFTYRWVPCPRGVSVHQDWNTLSVTLIAPAEHIPAYIDDLTAFIHELPLLSATLLRADPIDVLIAWRTGRVAKFVNDNARTLTTKLARHYQQIAQRHALFVRSDYFTPEELTLLGEDVVTGLEDDINAALDAIRIVKPRDRANWCAVHVRETYAPEEYDTVQVVDRDAFTRMYLDMRSSVRLPLVPGVPVVRRELYFKSGLFPLNELFKNDGVEWYLPTMEFPIDVVHPGPILQGERFLGRRGQATATCIPTNVTTIGLNVTDDFYYIIEGHLVLTFTRNAFLALRAALFNPAYRYRAAEAREACAMLVHTTNFLRDCSAYHKTEIAYFEELATMCDELDAAMHLVPDRECAYVGDQGPEDGAHSNECDCCDCIPEVWERIVTYPMVKHMRRFQIAATQLNPSIPAPRSTHVPIAVRRLADLDVPLHRHLYRDSSGRVRFTQRPRRLVPVAGGYATVRGNLVRYAKSTYSVHVDPFQNADYARPSGSSLDGELPGWLRTCTTIVPLRNFNVDVDLAAPVPVGFLKEVSDILHFFDHPEVNVTVHKSTRRLTLANLVMRIYELRKYTESLVECVTLNYQETHRYSIAEAAVEAAVEWCKMHLYARLTEVCELQAVLSSDNKLMCPVVYRRGVEHIKHPTGEFPDPPPPAVVHPRPGQAIPTPETPEPIDLAPTPAPSPVSTADGDWSVPGDNADDDHGAMSDDDGGSSTVEASSVPDLSEFMTVPEPLVDGDDDDVPEYANSQDYTADSVAQGLSDILRSVASGVRDTATGTVDAIVGVIMGSAQRYITADPEMRKLVQRHLVQIVHILYCNWNNRVDHVLFLTLTMLAEVFDFARAAEVARGFVTFLTSKMPTVSVGTRSQLRSRDLAAELERTFPPRTQLDILRDHVVLGYNTVSEHEFLLGQDFALFPRGYSLPNIWVPLDQRELFVRLLVAHSCAIVDSDERVAEEGSGILNCFGAGSTQVEVWDAVPRDALREAGQALMLTPPRFAGRLVRLHQRGETSQLYAVPDDGSTHPLCLRVVPFSVPLMQTGREFVADLVPLDDSAAQGPADAILEWIHASIDVVTSFFGDVIDVLKNNWIGALRAALTLKVLSGVVSTAIDFLQHALSSIFVWTFGYDPFCTLSTATLQAMEHFVLAVDRLGDNPSDVAIDELYQAWRNLLPSTTHLLNSYGHLSAEYLRAERRINELHRNGIASIVSSVAKPTPLVILCAGTTAVGKSAWASVQAIKQMRSHNSVCRSAHIDGQYCSDDPQPHHVANLRAGAEFHDHYDRQPVAILNEALTTTDAKIFDVEVQFIMNVSDSKAFTLNAAECSKKDRLSTDNLKYVFITSNVQTVTARIKVQQPEAFWGRLHLWTSLESWQEGPTGGDRRVFVWGGSLYHAAREIAMQLGVAQDRDDAARPPHINEQYFQAIGCFVIGSDDFATVCSILWQAHYRAHLRSVELSRQPLRQVDPELLARVLGRAVGTPLVRGDCRRDGRPSRFHQPDAAAQGGNRSDYEPYRSRPDPAQARLAFDTLHRLAGSPERIDNLERVMTSLRAKSSTFKFTAVVTFALALFAGYKHFLQSSATPQGKGQGGANYDPERALKNRIAIRKRKAQAVVAQGPTDERVNAIFKAYANVYLKYVTPEGNPKEVRQHAWCIAPGAYIVPAHIVYQGCAAVTVTIVTLADIASDRYSYDGPLLACHYDDDVDMMVVVVPTTREQVEGLEKDDMAEFPADPIRCCPQQTAFQQFVSQEKLPDEKFEGLFATVCINSTASRSTALIQTRETTISTHKGSSSMSIPLPGGRSKTVPNIGRLEYPLGTQVGDCYSVLLSRGPQGGGGQYLQVYGLHIAGRVDGRTGFAIPVTRGMLASVAASLDATVPQSLVVDLPRDVERVRSDLASSEVFTRGIYPQLFEPGEASVEGWPVLAAVRPQDGFRANMKPSYVASPLLGCFGAGTVKFGRADGRDHMTSAGQTTPYLDYIRSYPHREHTTSFFDRDATFARLRSYFTTTDTRTFHTHDWTQTIHGCQRCGMPPINMQTSAGWPFREKTSWIDNTDPEQMVPTPLLLEVADCLWDDVVKHNRSIRLPAAFAFKDERRKVLSPPECTQDETSSRLRFGDGADAVKRHFDEFGELHENDTYPPINTWEIKASRVLCGGAFPVNTLCRKYMGCVWDLFRSERNGVGTVVQDHEAWNTMGLWLSEGDRKIAPYDIEKQDRNFAPHVAELVIDVLLDVAGDAFNEDERKFVRALLESAFNSPLIVDCYIMMKPFGMNSGHWLTTLANTMAAIAAIEDALRMIACKMALPQETLVDDLRSKHYGDDGVLSLSAYLAHAYEYLSEAVEAVSGWKMTDSAKSRAMITVPLREAEFLSRKFHGKLAPLSIERLMSIIYIDHCADSDYIRQVKLDQFMEEVAHHGVHVFNEVHAILIRHPFIRGTGLTVMDYIRATESFRPGSECNTSAAWLRFTRRLAARDAHVIDATAQADVVDVEPKKFAGSCQKLTLVRRTKFANVEDVGAAPPVLLDLGIPAPPNAGLAELSIEAATLVYEIAKFTIPDGGQDIVHYFNLPDADLFHAMHKSFSHLPDFFRYDFVEFIVVYSANMYQCGALKVSALPTKNDTDDFPIEYHLGYAGFDVPHAIIDKGSHTFRIPYSSRHRALFIDKTGTNPDIQGTFKVAISNAVTLSTCMDGTSDRTVRITARFINPRFLGPHFADAVAQSDVQSANVPAMMEAALNVATHAEAASKAMSGDASKPQDGPAATDTLTSIVGIVKTVGEIAEAAEEFAPILAALAAKPLDVAPTATMRSLWEPDRYAQGLSTAKTATMRGAFTGPDLELMPNWSNTASMFSKPGLLSRGNLSTDFHTILVHPLHGDFDTTHSPPRLSCSRFGAAMLVADYFTVEKAHIGMKVFCCPLHAFTVQVVVIEPGQSASALVADSDLSQLQTLEFRVEGVTNQCVNFDLVFPLVFSEIMPTGAGNPGVLPASQAVVHIGVRLLAEPIGGGDTAPIIPYIFTHSYSGVVLYQRRRLHSNVIIDATTVTDSVAQSEAVAAKGKPSTKGTPVKSAPNKGSASGGAVPAPVGSEIRGPITGFEPFTDLRDPLRTTMAAFEAAVTVHQIAPTGVFAFQYQADLYFSVHCGYNFDATPDTVDEFNLVMRDARSTTFHGVPTMLGHLSRIHAIARPGGNIRIHADAKWEATTTATVEYVPAERMRTEHATSVLQHGDAPVISHRFEDGPLVISAHYMSEQAFEYTGGTPWSTPKLVPLVHLRFRSDTNETTTGTVALRVEWELSDNASFGCAIGIPHFPITSPTPKAAPPPPKKRQRTNGPYTATSRSMTKYDAVPRRAAASSDEYG